MWILTLTFALWISDSFHYKLGSRHGDWKQGAWWTNSMLSHKLCYSTKQLFGTHSSNRNCICLPCYCTWKTASVLVKAVLFLGSLAMDRTAGRWVRSRVVASSDEWTDNKIKYRGGRRGGGRRATTGGWVGWLVLGRDGGMWEGCQGKLSSNMFQPDGVVMESRAD